jgi:hypothetical protein
MAQSPLVSGGFHRASNDEPGEGRQSHRRARLTAAMSFIALCIVAAQEVIVAPFGVIGLKTRIAERKILRLAQNDI